MIHEDATIYGGGMAGTGECDPTLAELELMSGTNTLHH